MAKEAIKKVKEQLTKWEKIFTNHISKGDIQKYNKISKNQTIQTKDVQKT